MVSLEYDLIGFAGKAGIGKDTVVDSIIEQSDISNRLIKYAFADPVKEIAALLFSLDIDYFYHQDLKEQYIEFWELTPRKMMQLLGTEACRRTFGNDIWIKKMHNVYSEVRFTEQVLLIPDVRFEEEAAWIRSQGGLVVHVLGREPKGVGDHISEKGIRIKMGDESFFNDGSLDDLRDKAKWFTRKYLDRE